MKVYKVLSSTKYRIGNLEEICCHMRSLKHNQAGIIVIAIDQATQVVKIDFSLPPNIEVMGLEEFSQIEYPSATVVMFENHAVMRLCEPQSTSKLKYGDGVFFGIDFANKPDVSVEAVVKKLSFEDQMLELGQEKIDIEKKRLNIITRRYVETLEKLALNTLSLRDEIALVIQADVLEDVARELNDRIKQMETRQLEKSSEGMNMVREINKIMERIDNHKI